MRGVVYRKSFFRVFNCRSTAERFPCSPPGLSLVRVFFLPVALGNFKEGFVQLPTIDFHYHPVRPHRPEGPHLSVQKDPSGRSADALQLVEEHWSIGASRLAEILVISRWRMYVSLPASDSGVIQIFARTLSFFPCRRR